MSLLWFRKSRRPEAKADAPAAAESVAPAPRQARAPLRIRGLLLLNLQPADGIDRIENAPPLGTRLRVVSTIQAAIPGMQFEDGRGELAGADHRFTIDLGPHDPVQAAVATAEGSAAVGMLEDLLRRAGWRAYAARAGVFIEPDGLDLFALQDAAPRHARPD
jgi:hypothetical protein